jgi:hypothetical protein
MRTRRRDVARVVSDVSVLCPRAVDGADNSSVPLVTYKELARLYMLLCSDYGLPAVALLANALSRTTSFAGRLALDQEAPAS